MANFTLAQIEDLIGTPIILLTYYRRADNTHHHFSLRDLPPLAQVALVAWINLHWDDGA